MLKSFLKKPKNMKGVNIEHHFSDKQQFFLFVWNHIKYKADAGLTDQEVKD